MKRSGSIKRRTPLRRRNTERAAKRRERDFGKLAEYVRELPCAACGYPPPSDPGHVRSRGAGGHQWTQAGMPNILPPCRRCHSEQHAHGWEAVFPGQDPFEVAAEVVSLRPTDQT